MAAGGMKMKRYCAVFVLCSLFLFCLAGCRASVPENASSVNSETVVPAPTLHPEEIYSQLSSEKIAWGLKKVKGEKPEVPDSIIKTLDMFDGVYLAKGGGKNL